MAAHRDLVDVLGPASVVGHLHDTGHGWPAAVFGGPGIVRGTLVAPRDPSGAVELVARTDSYEAVPSLFVRTTVRALVDGVRCWAIAYAWNGAPMTMAPRPDGRWQA